MNLKGNSEWIVSEQFTLDQRTANYRQNQLEDGIVKVIGSEVGDNADLDPNCGRKIKGTIVVPKSYFGGGTIGDSLNIRAEVYYGDPVFDYDTVITTESDVIPVMIHNEYNEANNRVEINLKQKSQFVFTETLSASLGNSLMLDLDVCNTTLNEPQIRVTQESEDGDVKNFGEAYYDPETKSICLTPSEKGFGVLRIADVDTNDFIEVPYEVRFNESGINITKSNGIFKWFTPNGTLDVKGNSDPEIGRASCRERVLRLV